MTSQEARDAEQKKAVDTVLANWQTTGKKRVCLSFATGFGKTQVAILLAKRLNQDLGLARVAFLSDRILLLDQTNAAMRKAGLTTALVQGHRTDSPERIAEADVVMASCQTLDSRELSPKALEIDSVIVDEAHVQRRVVEQWMTRNPNLPFLGLTATPIAGWMPDAYDVLEAPLTTHDCIVSGFLQKLLFRVDLQDPTKSEHGRSVGRAGDEWTAAESEAIMSPHTKAIAEAWLELCGRDRSEGGFDGRQPPTVVQSSTKKHARALAETFGEVADGTWTALTDDQDPEESLKIVEKFRAGEINGLVTVHKAAIGFDAPDTSILVSARPTRRLITWVQFVGRAMRLPVTERGEMQPVVLDCAGNAHRFAARLHKFWTSGTKWPLPPRKEGGGGSFDGDQQPKVCPDHPKIMQPMSAQVCEICFRPLKDPEPVIEARKFRADVVTKGEVARTVLGLAQPRCLKQGGTEAAKNWARRQVMMLTGAWPRGTWPDMNWTAKDYGKPHPVVRRTIKTNTKAFIEWKEQDESERGPAPDPQQVKLDKPPESTPVQGV